jgi:hypothetical protein
MMSGMMLALRRFMSPSAGFGGNQVCDPGARDPRGYLALGNRGFPTVYDSDTSTHEFLFISEQQI